MDLLNVLLYGDPIDVSQKLTQYLGNTHQSQKAMVYFEFPNDKFNHPTILKNFPQKLKIFLLQPSIIKTVLSPKREFNNGNFVVWVFDWANPNSLLEGLKYLKKIAHARKSFIPIFLIGYRSHGSDVHCDSGALDDEIMQEFSTRFLRLYSFSESLSDMMEVPVSYFEIDEKRNESKFLLQLKIFQANLSKNDKPRLKKYSSITIDEIIKDVASLIENMDSNHFSQAIRPLMLSEFQLNRPITRKYLNEKYGVLPRCSKQIIEYWDSRPTITEKSQEELMDLTLEAESILTKFDEIGTVPNYVEMVQMGYDTGLIPEVLRFLYDAQEIFTISHHLESIQYSEFVNIREVMVICDGRTLYVKTTNEDQDQTLMFSNMIEAIEMIRNNYLAKSEGITVQQTDIIEFLEFGDLRAFIGKGNKGVKIIIRLEHRSKREEDLKKRMKSFLKSYENQVSLLPTTEYSEQKEIREQSERIFYRYFNPFPLGIDIFKFLKLKKEPQITDHLTMIELNIINLVASEDHLLIEDIIRKVSRQMNGVFSRSDLLQIILDLIDEGYLG